MKQVRAILGVVWQLLRELADEGAYERHLRHHGTAHSPEEWKRFSDGRLRAKYQRARCC
jgi:hypothetical protein